MNADVIKVFGEGFAKLKVTIDPDLRLVSLIPLLGDDEEGLCTGCIANLSLAEASSILYLIASAYRVQELLELCDGDSNVRGWMRGPKPATITISIPLNDNSRFKITLFEDTEGSSDLSAEIAVGPEGYEQIMVFANIDYFTEFRELVSDMFQEITEFLLDATEIPNFGYHAAEPEEEYGE